MLAATSELKLNCTTVNAAAASSRSVRDQVIAMIEMLRGARMAAMTDRVAALQGLVERQDWAVRVNKLSCSLQAQLDLRDNSLCDRHAALGHFREPTTPGRYCFVVEVICRVMQISAVAIANEQKRSGTFG